jgi:hypothetical protein
VLLVAPPLASPLPVGAPPEVVVVPAMPAAVVELPPNVPVAPPETEASPAALPIAPVFPAPLPVSGAELVAFVQPNAASPSAVLAMKTRCVVDRRLMPAEGARFCDAFHDRAWRLAQTTACVARTTTPRRRSQIQNNVKGPRQRAPRTAMRAVRVSRLFVAIVTLHCGRVRQRVRPVRKA